MVKGFVIGIANIIPGVSGGTMALILNIYERMIASINNISLTTVKKIGMLFTFRKKHFIACKKEMKKIDGLFFILVFLGVIAGIFAFSRVMTMMLKSFHDITYGFFFGLILASVFPVFALIKKMNYKVVVSLLIAAGAVVALSFAMSDQALVHAEQLKAGIASGAAIESEAGRLSAATFGGYLMILLTGAVATSAMILPGVSGSFISLLMGQYFIILNGVATGDILLLAVYGVGVIVGLKLFTKAVHYFFRRFHDISMGC